MILLAIGLCTLWLIGELTKSQIVKWLIRVCFSGVMMIIMNCLLPQYMINLNLYTLGFSTLLGVPGLMTLYVFQMII
ncbi:MAG: pro-sigmaK processing inhibitor BofA family protein [Candidatus Cellulosilyticum pullistercoris]|uniref:Pro-sigmaK processing inhibitor BofA family protein n=1 Tax=Candidatus Cellulosilyticum pullistercoris TaxID=2838521 RepID=A0A9E2KCF8_9FIRM|nr:pro-sigmaK processing inhibitor BofA family protein [Candidatus Cellulosilyticum pullistercoris]